MGRQLLGELRRLGIRRLCVPGRLRCRGYLPQCIAIHILLGRYVLCRGGFGERELLNEGSVEILRLAGSGTPCDAQLIKGSCEDRVSIDLSPPDKPRFIIDLALWGDHTESERSELVEQVLASIRVVRDYLWDGNVELTSVPGEFMEYMSRFARGFINRVVIRREGPVVGSDAVMLDPQGDCVLDDSKIREFSTFVIGGIVDKERRVKGETLRLYRLLNLGIPRCRIELKGSIVGVPDRINRIIEIILRALLEGRKLEESIIMSMSKRDRVNRLFYELQRASYRVRVNGNTIMAVTKPMLQSINWVGANDEELELAVRKAHVVIMEERELANYLSMGRARPGPWTHRYFVK